MKHPSHLMFPEYNHLDKNNKQIARTPIVNKNFGLKLNNPNFLFNVKI